VERAAREINVAPSDASDFTSTKACIDGEKSDTAKVWLRRRDHLVDCAIVGMRMTASPPFGSFGDRGISTRAPMSTQ